MVRKERIVLVIWLKYPGSLFCPSGVLEARIATLSETPAADKGVP